MMRHFRITRTGAPPPIVAHRETERTGLLESEGRRNQDGRNAPAEQQSTGRQAGTGQNLSSSQIPTTTNTDGCLIGMKP